MMRRALVFGFLSAFAAGPTSAFASSLGSVSAAALTSFSAASTVPTSSCSSNPTQDTWIDAAHTTTSHAASTTLQVASGSKPTYALVQHTPCALANARIVSATLQLHLGTAPSSPRAYVVLPITTSWAETVTWKTAPATSAVQSASATTGASGSWMSWSLTGDVQGIVDGGGNNGWAIEDNGSGTFTGTLDSREGSNPPVLAIVYYP